MVKANVDKILEILNEKKSISVGDLSKKLSIPKEDILQSAEYLEEDGAVRIDRKFPQTFIVLVQKKKQIEEMPPPPAPKISQKQQDSPVELVKSVPLQESNPTIQSQVKEMPPPPIPVNTAQPKPAPEQQINTQMPIAPKSIPLQPAQNQQPVEQKPIIEQKDFLIQNSGAENSNNQIITVSSTNEETNKASQIIEDYSSPSTPDDPLEIEKPVFDMNAPAPQEGENRIQTRMQDEEENISFSQETDSPTDKIEYTIDMIHNKIREHSYSNLNVLYRQLYNLYQHSDLSPNERYLLGDKINSVFHMIKKIYLTEKFQS
jgi:hypothetical protein